jgi:predicted O-linked N-acetylglucosamine transferase (SPINDLY family)
VTDKGNQFNKKPDDSASTEDRTSLDPNEKLIEALQNHQAGNLANAEKIYRDILSAHPTHPDSLHFLGILTHQIGRNRAAVDLITKSIELNPRNPSYYNNLGRGFQEQGSLEKAVKSYEKALELNSEYAAAYNNLGTALQEQGKMDEGLSCYQKAVELEPEYAEAHNNLGTALQGKGRLNRAISHYEKAIQLQPEYVDAYNNLGSIFREQGKFDETISCFDRALQLSSDPGIMVKKCISLPMICESRQSIQLHRRNLSEQIRSLRNQNIKLDDPYRQVGLTVFPLAYHGLDDRQLQEKLARFYIHACPDLEWRSPKGEGYGKINGKIKIGIVSRFLYDHTIGILNLGIIEKLSREKFNVKLFHFAGKEDHVSKALNKAADQVVPLPSQLQLARQRIAEHSLDILFYLDIGMDPLTYFIAFSRLSPVQCVTWGHPVTTGIQNMDYYLSSKHAEPLNAQENYTEQLVLMSNFPVHFERPDLPKKLRTRKYFDLPEKSNVYVCAQNIFKFHPDIDDLFGSILRQDRNAILVVFEASQKHPTELLRERFINVFPEQVNRVRFFPRLSYDEFLSFLKLADVVLDTIHFNGGLTNLIAFACDLPIVTWPKSLMRGRLTYAMYRQMGVMDCVAHDAKSYTDIALRLANDRDWRAHIVEKISTRSHVLYEDIEAVRELETFFERAIDNNR